jgi:hypothetical protein
MPSSGHEALVEMVRSRPDVVAGLLGRLLDFAVPAHAGVRLESCDLSQLQPTEWRADAVVALVDDCGKPVLAVVVEVQRSRDGKKRFAWPVYVATLRARLRCGVLLVVIACDPEAARWCQQPIRLGHPGLVLRPLVVGPDVVPVVTDADQASSEPWLAVLAALAHHDHEARDKVFLAFLDGIEALDRDEAAIYMDIVQAGLPELARRQLETLMATGTYEFKSDFFRRPYGMGHEQGKTEGKAEGEAAALLTVLKARGLTVPAAVRRKIMACTDTTQLTSWLERAVTVRRVDDLFA